MGEMREAGEMPAVTEEQRRRYDRLCRCLRGYGSVVVAYSGGVDSTFLLKAAHDELGERAVAVTVCSNLIPERELSEAGEFCGREGIRQILHKVDELAIEGFAENPPDRCYRCKRSIFEEILEAARTCGASVVAEGSNVDDCGDYRPGMRAVAELAVKSPLREAGLTKADIRALSRMLGLPTWDKPSFACLASRFVYGERITAEKLRMVERAEELLRSLGFCQMRVRMHQTMARIEVLPEDIPRLLEDTVRTEIAEALKEYGFSYVSVDLSGYRMGSMNDGLEENP